MQNLNVILTGVDQQSFIEDLYLVADVLDDEKIMIDNCINQAK